LRNKLNEFKKEGLDIEEFIKNQAWFLLYLSLWEVKYDKYV
jgi:hypothetical protein